MVRTLCSYQQSSGDKNKDTATFARRLCIQRGDLVLDFGEWKVLYANVSQQIARCAMTSGGTYDKLLCDGSGALSGRVLESQHGLLFLYIPAR